MPRYRLPALRGRRPYEDHRKWPRASLLHELFDLGRKYVRADRALELLQPRLEINILPLQYAHALLHPRFARRQARLQCGNLLLLSPDLLLLLVDLCLLLTDGIDKNG